MMKKKRDATRDEVKSEIRMIHARWNLMNSGYEKTENYWIEKLREAESEGYKSEVCDCGNVFLAFHHFTTCRDNDCPFSDGVSVLQQLSKGDQDGGT